MSNVDSNAVLRVVDRDDSANSPPAKKPTWASRHPWLAFVFGAPSLFLICVIVYMLVLIGAGSAAGRPTMETNPAALSVFMSAAKAVAFVPAIVAAAWLCWRVARSGRKARWAMAGCCLIAVLAACLFVDCVAPKAQPNSGKLTLGFGVGSSMRPIQSIGPFLVGVLYVAAISRRRRTPPTQALPVPSGSPLSKAA
jgi:hypothetical protein